MKKQRYLLPTFALFTTSLFVWSNPTLAQIKRHSPTRSLKGQERSLTFLNPEITLQSEATFHVTDWDGNCETEFNNFGAFQIPGDTLSYKFSSDEIHKLCEVPPADAFGYYLLNNYEGPLNCVRALFSSFYEISTVSPFYEVNHALYPLVDPSYYINSSGQVVDVVSSSIPLTLADITLACSGAPDTRIALDDSEYDDYTERAGCLYHELIDLNNPSFLDASVACGSNKNLSANRNTYYVKFTQAPTLATPQPSVSGSANSTSGNTSTPTVSAAPTVSANTIPPNHGNKNEGWSTSTEGGTLAATLTVLGAMFLGLGN